MENSEFYDIWEEKLYELFKKLGIGCGTKGEAYLRELVAWYRPGMQMQELLAAVGVVLNADPRAVERTARAAILRGCARATYDFDTWEQLFGNAISPSTGAPRLSEFVARVRRHICGPNT